MITLIKQNKLLSIIITVFVFALLYYAFFSDKSAPAVGLSTSDTAGASVQSEQLLIVLANLKTIQLNNAIFQDPVYLSLSDYGISIPLQATGRRDPFSDVQGQVTQTKDSVNASVLKKTGH